MKHILSETEKNRLLSFRELSQIFGQSVQFWRRQYWKGNIVNYNLTKGKFLFLENEVLDFILSTKEQ